MAGTSKGKKRTNVYNGIELINRHYRISDEIHLKLVILSTSYNQSISSLVRDALTSYFELPINKTKLTK